MTRPGLKFFWSLCLVFFVFAAANAMAGAQENAPPPPPDDAQTPTLQQTPQQNDVRAVRLSEVQGSVRVLKDGEVAFTQAQPNMPVVQGMRFVTADDGRAEIQFEDGSVARLTPNSSVTLTQLSRQADGNTITTIEVDTGLTYYELNGRSGQYSVRLGRQRVVPLDSSIFRIDLDISPADLAVTHGSVQVSNDEDLSADVHTNQSMRIDPQSPDTYQILPSVAENSWDQWNSDRDEALAQMDENATEARADTGDPDNPAWSDLDANGDWYDVPGYGMGWAPSGVGQDWDPYGAGSWGYYDGIGYTWISAYSWGWWPYRCGAWSWFDGFGWMWFPGNCGWGGVDFGWCPYGVIRQIPPGYRILHRPRPIPHPIHGPAPVVHPPLIAVNRGPRFTHQVHAVSNVRLATRVFQYDGQKIPPVTASIHPHQGGPLGEGFTSTVERTNPSVMVRGAYGGTGYRPPAGAGYRPSAPVAPIYQPRRGYTPPPSHPVYTGGGRVSAPAPAPSFHPSPPPAPAPSFHPSPPPAPSAPAGHAHR